MPKAEGGEPAGRSPAAGAGTFASATVVRTALIDAASLGPFFAVSVDPAEEADPAWRPFTALWRTPELLDGLVAAYARRLGTGEERVAASILFQGLAARLWSPVVASAAAHGIVPDLSSLHWRWAPGAPVALWLAEPAGWPAGDREARVEAAHRTVVRDHLAPLRDALRRTVRSDGLMWGNVAAALAGIRHAGTVRPELARPITELVEALLVRPPLTGTGELVRPVADRPERFFVRRSCCLYYRVPPGGDKCGDCVLIDDETRRRQWRRATG